MTQRLDRLSFSRTGTVSVAVGLFAAALSGCMSATIEDAAPTAALKTTGAAEMAPVEAASSGAPKDTGTFPNLNIKPQVATEQITPEEKAAHVQALTAAQQQHAATSATAGKGTTNPVLLRKLATTHATDALKEIEGK